MSDSDSTSTEPDVASLMSAGISPDLEDFSIDEHAEVDDDNPAPRTDFVPSSSDAAEQHSQQHAAGSVNSHDAASASPSPPSSGPSSVPRDLPPTAARKLPAISASISQQVDDILRAIDQATNEKRPSTALPFPKHLVNLPVSFVSIALQVADVLHSLKPNHVPHRGKGFESLLNQAVKLLNTNDTTRLEAAMLTLHSLHLAASSKLGSNIALWGERFLLWSEENKILMREALDLFETMCSPSCKHLTLWYFRQALSHEPMLPFSALLGRYTPAHVRKSADNLANVLTTLKEHGKPMSCKEFQKVARKISKPPAQKQRPSVAKTTPFTQTVLKESRKIARCVAVVGETMDAVEKDTFRAMVDTLAKEPSLDDAVAFLEYPMQKRRRTS